MLLTELLDFLAGTVGRIVIDYQDIHIRIERKYLAH
jgi:hypothetical protein